MKTPVRQIMLLSMAEHHSGNNAEAQTIVGAQIAALESAGYVIAHPDQVTEEVAQAAFDVVARIFRDEGCEPNIEDLRKAIVSALRAAPQLTKGNEG